MEIIKINNLTKKFGNFTALDNLNLSVKAGEIYGFIGPNGAGKSTTIRIILGLLKPTSGSVNVFGLEAFNNPKEIHKRIAYVPAEANLWGNLTGGEVIDILLKMSNIENNELKENLIQRFDLDTSKKCRTYSKGNKQKVTLIAAFATDADLYILDEPTSGLDPLMENIFQDFLIELKNQGKTIFLSSHILSEVEKVCDKIAIIKNGRIVDSGNLTDMRHLTKSKFIIKSKDKIDLSKIEGISNIKESNEKLEFLIDANAINKTLNYLSNYKLDFFQANPPTLEDLFLSYYEEK